MKTSNANKSVLAISALAALAAAVTGWAILSASALWSPPAPVAAVGEFGRFCWRMAEQGAASVAKTTGTVGPTVGLFLLASLLYGGFRGGMNYLRTRRFLARLPLESSGSPRSLLGETPSSPDEGYRVNIVKDPGLFAFTGGFLRPSIYVSRGMTEGFTPDELRAVLRHEATHVSRKDPLRGWLADALAGFLWFLPLADYLRRQFLTASEEEADDRATTKEEDTLSLASALVKAAQGQTRTVYVAAPGFGGEISLSERVERLIGVPSLSAARRYQVWLPVLGRSLGVVVLLAILSMGGFDFIGTQSGHALENQAGPGWMMRPGGDPSGQGMRGRMMRHGPGWNREMRQWMKQMWNRGGMGPGMHGTGDSDSRMPPRNREGFPQEWPNTGSAR